jgi:phosphate transport system permease protein
MKGFARRRRADRLFGLACGAAVFLTLFTLAAMLGKIAYDGVARLNVSFLFDELSHRPDRTGVLPALIGSVYLVALTLLLSVPIGIGAAIYLEEFADTEGKLGRVLRLGAANLAGVPSIIYGLVGLAVFVRFFGFGQSLLSGAATLTLVILPTIVVVTQEALRAVPRAYREASIALGASERQTVVHQILPPAAKGIGTGLLLSISRALGETAPLIVVGAAYFVTGLPRSPSDPYTVLPMQIFSWSSDARREFHADAAATTLVLVLILLILNLLTFRMRRVIRHAQR